VVTVVAAANGPERPGHRAAVEQYPRSDRGAQAPSSSSRADHPLRDARLACRLGPGFSSTKTQVPTERSPPAQVSAGVDRLLILSGSAIAENASVWRTIVRNRTAEIAARRDGCGLGSNPVAPTFFKK
jgi:hypothetical protein